MPDRGTGTPLPVRLVGLVSCYKEGSLTRAAVESLLEAEPETLLIYEGPAGDPIEADCPRSWLPVPIDQRDTTRAFSGFRRGAATYVRHGRWRTDARKRQAMLEHAKLLHSDGPLWGVWLDGDEVLVNGAYLRDLLQQLQWQDEQRPEGEPWSRYPVRLIEADGGMALMTGRVVRLDLIREYRISTSIVVNDAGVQEGYGNVPVPSNVWLEHFLGAVDRGRMVAWPPLPCEPHIFHRSHLRHPNRQTNRLHAQEADELRRAGIKP